MKSLELESGRIASVRETGVLDSPNEPVLDQIVALAAAICHAPISLISIVDSHRQWFKAKFGIIATELPRLGSFCTEAMWESDLFIVPDANKDPRFASSSYMTRDHSIRFYAGMPLMNRKGHAMGTLCIMDRVPRDLTELQKQSLRTLAKSVEVLLARKFDLDQRFADSVRLRSIFEQESDSIDLLARDGTLVDINSAGLRLLGANSLPEVQGSSLLAYVAKKDHRAFLELHEQVLDGGSGALHYESSGFNGRNSRQVKTIASPIRDAENRIVAALYITRDITESNQLNERFLRAQRMENLGMLATGIAHDLNNILTPMMMLSPMLADRLNRPADQRLLAALDTNARRGAGLVKQILSFAHGNDGEKSAVNLKHLAGDISSMVEATFPHNITLVKEISTDLAPIKADPTQIHQVLLNLCVNARDAMPSGGTLHLTIANCTLDLIAAAAIPEGRAGHFLLIEVADTGTGIPEEIQKKIWEPFFTTKPEGKGTGLGLSTVRSIIKRHGGFATLASRVGEGTRFRFYLPVEGVRTSQEPRDWSTPIIPGGGETILIVDDEANVRDFTSTLLERNGYRALTARNGKEAVEILTTQKSAVALIITEPELPDVNGAQFCAALKRISPEVPLLYCAAGDSRLFSAENQPPILLKPFGAHELFTAIQRLVVPNKIPARIDRCTSAGLKPV